MLCHSLFVVIIKFLSFVTKVFLTPNDGFELVTGSFVRNLLHCAAVVACHFYLATVAIRVDTVHIYLCGNVKVVVERRGFESECHNAAQREAAEATQRIVHLSACLCKADEGSCCEICTRS